MNEVKADFTDLMYVSAFCMNCGQSVCHNKPSTQCSQGRDGLDDDEALQKLNILWWLESFEYTMFLLMSETSWLNQSDTC